MAASATFALKAGLCVRRTRLAIVAPGMRHSRRSQADFPLIDLSEFARPPLCCADPKTVWTSVMLTEWYGGQTRKLESVCGTAVWYHNGVPPAAIRWVLVRDPSGRRDT